MASPLKQHDELDAIDREIDVLEMRLLDEDRAAHDIVIADGQDEHAYERLEAKAFMTRQILGRLLREHRRIAREILGSRCPVHPADALFVGCDQCRRAWGVNEARVA